MTAKISTRGVEEISLAEFCSLSPLEQAEVFVRSSDAKRIELVEAARRPDFIQYVPPIEVWLTIKRLTPHDALSLISVTTPEQLELILDIETWRKDRIHLPSVIEWLGYISACGDDKLMEWFKKFDFDQIIWFFKNSIVVFKREDKEVDPADAFLWPREAPPITYEGVYYFQVVDEKHEDLILHMMNVLVREERELFYVICEACIWDLSSVREEAAYEEREKVLAENGFPPFDEAIAVYSPLSKEGFFHTPKKEVSMGGSDAGVIRANYPSLVIKNTNLFVNTVISEMEGRDADMAILEIASIANKILVADGLVMDLGAVGFSLLKSIGGINIGLEEISGMDVSKAVQIAREHWLLNVFQFGFGYVRRLGEKARRVFKNGWLGGDEKNLSLLDDAEEIFLKALLRRSPLYVPKGASTADLARPFLSISDVREAEERIKYISLKGEYVAELIKLSAGEVMAMTERMEDLKLEGIFVTVLLNEALFGERVFKPIPLHIFNTALSGGRFPSIVKECALTKGGGEIKRFVDEAVRRFADEVKYLKVLDKPHFINSVWVEEIS